MTTPIPRIMGPKANIQRHNRYAWAVQYWSACCVDTNASSYTRTALPWAAYVNEAGSTLTAIITGKTSFYFIRVCRSLLIVDIDGTDDTCTAAGMTRMLLLYTIKPRRKSMI